MGEVSTIGLDLAKEEFQVRGADVAGAGVFRLSSNSLPLRFDALIELLHSIDGKISTTNT